MLGIVALISQPRRTGVAPFIRRASTVPRGTDKSVRLVAGHRKLPVWAKAFVQRDRKSERVGVPRQVKRTRENMSYPLTLQNALLELSQRLAGYSQCHKDCEFQFVPASQGQIGKAVASLLFSVCVYSLRFSKHRDLEVADEEIPHQIKSLSSVIGLKTLNKHQLNVLLRKFLKMRSVLKDTGLDINPNEFPHWFNAVTAADLGDALQALRKCQSKVPDFITHDVLLRAPDCQDFPRWLVEFKRNSKRVVSTDQNMLQQYTVPPILHSLIQNCMQYDIPQLIPSLRKYLKEVTVKDLNADSTSLVISQMNEVIWYISSLQKLTSRDPNYHATIQKAQALVAKFAIEFSDGANAKDILDVNGLLGLAYSMSLTNSTETRSLISMAKDNFDLWKLESFSLPEFEHVNKKRVIHHQGLDWQTRLLIEIRFILVELVCCNTPEELKKVLEKAIPLKQRIISIFPDFYGRVLSKMDQLGILTERRAILAWESYLVQNPAQLDHELLKHALYAIDNIPRKNTLLKQTVALGFETSPDIALSYIKKLYSYGLLRSRRNNAEPVQGVFTVLKDLKDAASLTHFEVPGFQSAVDLARYLYVHLEQKDRSTISVHLYYEALLNPETALERYMELSHPEKFVWSLLLAVYRADELPKFQEKEMKWGDRYAIDVAIEEFQNVINFMSSSHGPKAQSTVQNSRTWVLYIRLLSKYNSQSWLNDILQWWVDTRIVPTRSLLACLLAHLNDSTELYNFVMAYQRREERYHDGTVRSELEMKHLKSKDKYLAIPKFDSTMDKFVGRMEANYSVLREWDWPNLKEIDNARKKYI
ncbi:unnamed protein product [Kuraishia capsulata CBS 1993]|uniref:Uncharacterized protein n=1 Tax=Kuraishia capsulata CBS 1993 TaxID=1382522 RepID=W6MFM8_9ASCO|nr:uncharacterized protein KUCA_T00000128001 [Kuraishia capsulata CBS 1993]CDK24168.1 unnamed protein product [Kuraishia capsulata CBS 1993]